MTILSIETINIQSHKDSDNKIILPEKGIVRFKGNNNDGKSVIPKVFEATVKQSLTDPDIRRTLISTGYSYGEFIITKTNGDKLKVHISEEASQTYYEFTFGEEVIKRYLSSKGIDSLIAEFGFHYIKKHDTSLNIYSTYDPLLMMTTSPTMNLDIIESAIKNTRAETALANIEEVRKEIKQNMRDIEVHKESSVKSLASLQEYNISREETIINLGKMILTDLKYISQLPPEPPMFKDDSFLNDLVLLTPKVDFNELMKELIVPEQDLITDLSMLYRIGKLTDLRREIEELIEIEDAVAKDICPTCLRPHHMEVEVLCESV